MKHVNKSGILLALVLMVGMTLAATTGRRTVVMQIDLPDGSTPQLKVFEGNVATIGLRTEASTGSFRASRRTMTPSCEWVSTA